MRAAVLSCLLVCAACELEPLNRPTDGNALVTEEARILRAQIEIATLESELIQHHLARGEWPADWWSMRRSPRDPWGKPYAFSIRDGDPVVYSAGQDGQFATGDDVYAAEEYGD